MRVTGEEERKESVKIKKKRNENPMAGLNHLNHKIQLWLTTLITAPIESNKQPKIVPQTNQPTHRS